MKIVNAMHAAALPAASKGDVPQFWPRQRTITYRNIIALLFLVAIASTPLVIVVLGSRAGGFFVAGYLTGIVATPMVAIGGVRAITELLASTEREGLVGVLVFGVLVTFISLAAAFWAIFIATH